MSDSLHSFDPITVSSPGRLHFGLFAVGDLVPRQFGGIGLMVEQPRTIIQATDANRFRFVGQQEEACLAAAQRWFDSFDVASQLTQLEINALSLHDLPVQLNAVELPPRHSGLGSGTQIALTVATALNRFFHLKTPSVEELAVAVGRAKRSAIGSHGFAEGGFLVDRGKAPGEQVAQLDFHVDFPEAWKVVLMFPIVDENEGGLAGEQEQAAFRQIPATTLEQYAAMQDMVQQRIVPGVVNADYDQFAEGLFEFGHRSGLYFEFVQGGPYNGPRVQALVDHVRDFGVAATGQTSWGPCVFAITRDHATADSLASSVTSAFAGTCRVQVTSADNAGVLINDRPNLAGRSSVINRLDV